MDVEGLGYIVKPMNCPFHIQIYQSALRSYREFPLRWAELGTVYRYERSGVLHGLFRVRGFTQDDAHIFCREDQLREEIREVLRFNFFVLKAFGFKDFEVYLSTQPEKFVGSQRHWDLSTSSLKQALEEEGFKYQIDPGEGVFYGPKIDIKIRDALSRLWQCSTIQVDFNLPERFGLTYIGNDGNKHTPIMIHRALLGSLERFFGILVEHYAGAFPTWLSPVQVKVLTVTSDFEDYGKEMKNRLIDAGIRAQLDIRSEKLGAKIRDAQIGKVPYMLIVGKREAEAEIVNPRSRVSGEMESMSLEEFISFIKAQIREKT